jgi:hypothetical protein
MSSEQLLAVELFGIGVLIFLARHISSSEVLTWRQILGKAILNGAASLCAGALVLFIANPPTIALIGVAAFLGSLGSDATVSYISKLRG